MNDIRPVLFDSMTALERAMDHAEDDVHFEAIADSVCRVDKQFIKSPVLSLLGARSTCVFLRRPSVLECPCLVTDQLDRMIRFFDGEIS